MTIEEMILFAKSVSAGADMQHSCLFCISSSEEFLKNGETNLSKLWVLKSLKYSLGVSHPVYKEHEKIIKDSVGYVL